MFHKTADLPGAGQRTLPGRFYTSDEVYQQEAARIFQRSWLCAGRADRLQEPGDFLVRTTGAESVIFVMGRDSVVRAFHNVCRHRGTRICDEATGRFKQLIRCPYHSWAYGLDGNLHSAPAMEDVPDFDMQDYPLHPVNVQLWEGFIYYSLAQDPEPFEAAFSPLIGKFANYCLPGMFTGGSIIYDVAANWKLIFENYSECYHCSCVHPALVKLSPANSGSNDLLEGPFLGGYMEMKQGVESMTLSGKTCGIAPAAVSADDLHRIYYYTLFPNVLLSLHPDYVMAHTLWPESPSRTRIECEWLFQPGSRQHPDYNPQDAIEFWDKTNREDWRICELSQLGISSSAYTPGPYSPRETMSAAFDREYVRVMGEL